MSLAIIATALAGLAAALSLSSLRRGIDALDAAVSAVDAGDKSAALSNLATARGDFGHSSSRLDAWWADPAELVPGVREHLLALRAGSTVGDEVATSGIDLEPNLELQSATFGPSLLVRLNRLESGLRSTNAVLVHAEQQLSSAQSGWLIPEVANGLTSALSTVRQAQHDAYVGNAGVTAAQALLGGDGPRRYFLAIESESEARGNGGILGNYGVLSADNGKLSLVSFGRDSDLNAAGDPATRHLTDLASFVANYGSLQPQVYWQNVLASPNFPTDAAVIEQLYPQSGGTKLNGVIAIDPAGLAALLSIVGPVSVPSWPVPLTAANATNILLNTQYDDLTGDARVDFLGQVAAAVWSHLSTAKLQGLSTLATTLGAAIAEKHLMFSDTNPTTEHALVVAGASGSMTRPAGSDFLAVTNENASGNKIDYYLRRSITYSVNLQPSTRSLSGQVIVQLQNLAPSSGEPPYVIGSVANPAAPLGINNSYVSFYTPWAAAGATLDGHELALASGNEAGMNVYSAFVSIPAGGTVTLNLNLSGTMPSTSSYGLELFRQPTVAPDTVAVHVDVSSPWQLLSPSSGLATTDGIASADLQLLTNETLRVAIAKG